MSASLWFNHSSSSEVHPSLQISKHDFSLLTMSSVHVPSSFCQNCFFPFSYNKSYHSCFAARALHCLLPVSNLLSSWDGHTQSAVTGPSSFSFYILNEDFYVDIKYHISAAATYTCLEHSWKWQIRSVWSVFILWARLIPSTTVDTGVTSVVGDCCSTNLASDYLLFFSKLHHS